MLRPKRVPTAPVKIIIHLQGTLVTDVYASQPIEYVVVDQDDSSEKPLVVDRPRDGKNITDFTQTNIFHVNLNRWMKNK